MCVTDTGDGCEGKSRVDCVQQILETAVRDSQKG